MRTKRIALCLAIAVACAGASAQSPAPRSAQQAREEQAVLQLSRQKWLWMAERNVKALDALFDEKSVFVHMGGTMTKQAELGVITSGDIQYKKADVQDVSVRIIGSTAIVLSKIQLFALVHGNEAINPFTVTEVYVKEGRAWKLGSLSFTRLLTP